MIVRPATAADLPFIVALEGATPTAAHWNSADYQHAIAGGEPPRVALVADADAQVRGFLVARRIEREWEIENVVVAAEWRGRGLGSALLGAILELARGAGAQRVFLEVRESNLVARGLYEKWSFARVGRRKSYYSNPIEDALVYQWPLAQDRRP